MNNSVLYSALTRFGDCYSLRLRSSLGNIIKDLENNFEWVQYNPRKSIRREGLSITSLDGGLSGRPDLDSLYDYRDKTGIVLKESNFTVKTPVYDYFKEWLDPIQQHIGRTHIIKLNDGGYFPPHRDNKNSNVESFRLFLPLNYDSMRNFFMLENRKLEFTNGEMYFIDTAKMHTLFNTSVIPFYFVVVNVILTDDSVNDIIKYLPG
jgi:hypothetical protein